MMGTRVRNEPDVVRRQLVRWAADTLGALPPDQVPAALRGVARFRPGRRAALGATALATALDGDQAFRAAVGDHARALGIDLDGERSVAERAAAALLWQHPKADELLAAATESDQLTALRTQVEQLTAEVERLRRTDGEPPSPGPSTAGSSLPAESDDAANERLQRLQQRLRTQGVALREARDEVARVTELAATAAAREQAELRLGLDRALAEAKVLRERLAAEQTRAQRAQEQLDRLRDADRGHREAADRRLDLLLQTVEGAAAGLRREWQLTGGGPDPAQRVADTLAWVAPAPAGDTASLLGWLSMPHAHLIVDGYNVTKRAWPELTLAEQRDRLVRDLARLAARSGAEVTVVFDGAAVLVPQTRARGVRVLFSPPGTIADEVIRQLVAAEPPGRVVLVATADREVIEWVQRRAARQVPPVLLLESMRSEDRARG